MPPETSPAPASDPTPPSGEPAPSPAPAPAPGGAPESKKDDPVAAELAALKAQFKTQEKELEKFKKTQKERDDAEKTAAEKLAERDAEVAALKRQTLIDRVRRDGGYTGKVFDAVSVSGDDEDAIKSAFETFKASLDAYTKEQGVKAAPGGGTGDAKDPGKNKPTGKDTRPYLLRRGLVSENKAV